MKINHTLYIDLDALTRVSAMEPERLTEDDVKYLMGGELYNHNEIDLEVETEVIYHAEEPQTRADSGWPAMVELKNESCVEDYAWREAMERVDDCPAPARKLRIFRLLSEKISTDYRYWAEKKMLDVALEQARREQFEVA